MSVNTPAPKKERVVVLDDDPAGRYLKSHILRREGYDVVEAATGGDGMSAAKAATTALVVCDVKLPDMSGLDVCRILKQTQPATMVLQTSAAFTASTHRAAGLAGGADAYVVEPLAPQEFLATVDSLMRRYRAGLTLTDELARNEERIAEMDVELRNEKDQRAEAQDLLRHSQKLDVLGQLTGGIAHDFNNMLTIVMGNLESLRRQLAQSSPDVERLRTYADRAFSGAERAAGITRQLLAFSRRQALDPKVLNLNGALTQVSDFMRQVLGERVATEIVGADNLWPIRVDPGQLETAILNISLNARDAMPDGGTLRIETRNATIGREEGGAAEMVLLRIADSGVGMPESVLNLAFEPFFTTKDVGHGTGLGLSQVYGFVKQTGGHVEIDSKPGKGTELRIYLPRYEGPLLPENPEEPEQERGVPDGMGRRVLVVEDDPDVADHLVGLLRELGYVPQFASSGEEALRAIDEQMPFDLLITDVGLPGGMSGPALAEAAKGRGADLPTLFVSGYAADRLGREGLGFDAPVLHKPYTFDKLAQACARVLRARAQHGSVLVVEDEPMIRMDLAYSLTQLGFKVREAGSSAEALKVMAEEGDEISALITDVGLPDGRGDELALRMRVDRVNLPVIVTTGYGGAAQGNLVKDSWTAFLAKPYHPDQVAEALRRMGVGLPPAA